MLARRARAAAAAARVAAPALLAAFARGKQPCLSYGHPRLPSREEVAHGGMVKLQALAELFPPTPAFNLAYLVSSALPSGAATFAALARAGGAKLVVNQNGVASPMWPGPGWQAVNRSLGRVLHRAHHVFYQSEFCRLAADRFLGRFEGPSEVLHNAIDTETFRPAAQDPDPERLVLLLGGNQDHRYRLDAALQTLRRLKDAGVGARLLVTGRFRWGGDENAATAEARAMSRALGLEDAVALLGPYRRDEAPAVFQRAHVLLHTQYNDACPGLVIEAMASGLPVAYSASGGVPELVGAEAGVGVPAELSFEAAIPPDPDALADAVRALARDRARYATAARQRALARFGLASWLARHRAVFEAIVGGR